MKNKTIINLGRIYTIIFFLFFALLFALSGCKVEERTSVWSEPIDTSQMIDLSTRWVRITGDTSPTWTVIAIDTIKPCEGCVYVGELKDIDTTLYAGAPEMCWVPTGTSDASSSLTTSGYYDHDWVYQKETNEWLDVLIGDDPCVDRQYMNERVCRRCELWQRFGVQREYICGETEFTKITKGIGGESKK